MADSPRLFLVRAGRSGEDEDYSLDHGLAVIGFRDIPSLERAKDYGGIFAIVEQSMPSASPHAVRNYTGQLWAFSQDMKDGDLVVMPRKTTAQIAIGRVSGGYRYMDIGGTNRHTRVVKWIKSDIPRVVFQQDLLHSFGAFMTVCSISRNDAVRRVMKVLEGGVDSTPPQAPPKAGGAAPPKEAERDPADERPDIALAARDQIAEFIEQNFKGHALTELVDAVLHADGWVTKRSPPGPDGGVDILAGRGLLGLDAPRLAVQVKSQTDTADVTVYRTLQGSMQSFKAEQGLLVCWGGFNKAVLNESKVGHFAIRLWDSDNLTEAVFRSYPKLSKDIQTRLPLKQVWMLVEDETALG